ncbi:type II toxin-antitoxin system VapC family toxin [Thermoleptolyngbya oregonensis NK1-22]|uniref:Type II toxin-antitoxin system VapC family toxin n=1 Tax=Thermoleptolyngbya oregonensis NK1-22 TaxID=2547457 RepID=A0AA97BAU5_9CYAN|nr:type II toxin-antitoxin system VapC family toxin [Thermoleptolyngbya oregonensis]WOB45250.1 type II toxin-antitoxin system VapC family toxin [Thermoleptolyngbya oregonensis NK1-22]
MNGVKLLLDTNFIIGLVKGNVQVANLLQDRSINLEQCAYSFITRIELLSYPTITDAEVRAITSILNAMEYLPMTQTIEDMTIKIRRQYKLKTPDAIIAATVKVMSLELLTLDQQLANRMMEILAGT